MRAVAPGAVSALMALANRLLTRCFNGNDNGCETGALAAVAAVTIGQIRRESALAISLFAGRLVDDDGLSTMSWFGQCGSFATRDFVEILPAPSRSRLCLSNHNASRFLTNSAMTHSGVEAPAVTPATFLPAAIEDLNCSQVSM